MAILTTDTEIPEELIRRFDKPGPRYTSYPTADRFRSDFTAETYHAYLGQRKTRAANPPLSLYIHLPFCESLCYFCACNKIITQDHGRVAEYLHYLKKELQMVAAQIGPDRHAIQLHLGGGTPTFFNSGELSQLMYMVRQHFHFSKEAELSIEIDPRTVQKETLAVLARLGFNRTSFGVQDFDPQVQLAVNRIQPFEMVANAVMASRAAGFQSINADLIYGLPKQTLESFDRTLDQLIEVSPDRIALYNYAHLPSRFKAQRLIVSSDLPSAETRLQIFMMSTRRLLQAGYEFIGLDHFAKPDDELNLARLDNTLHRNFQGYTTRADCDLIGFGVSAIGKVGNSYNQSVRTVKAYYEALDAERLPVEKGFELNADDLLGRQVIMTLMCSVPLVISALERQYGINFLHYFEAELAALEQYRKVGLLDIASDSLCITSRGRFFVRAISMVFDRYLTQPTQSTYSKLI
jgi:oxygen-independent coproporphyrinogen III oxidase